MPDCTPSVPFPLNPDPITDAEAALLGYDVMLDRLVDGQCDCIDPYTAPECPACDCADLTAEKQFTISDMEGEYYGSFNGTYTLTKGEVGGNECCWFGYNEGALQSATLCWASGQWVLVVGDATYQMTVSSPCAGTLTLPKTDDPTGEFPASVEVT